ncbi:snaclec coagulation factor IX/factor X-binding protein subunit A-like [Narcine bancroftii]|uniref:snaclec coagulation factor IX/factor X-binding protein subunit A-like n=1 Tax=Narcine bancroftii TaxID=1343680 RepID=UPI00383185AB
MVLDGGEGFARVVLGCVHDLLQGFTLGWGGGYHLIKEQRSWPEARDYCRNRYTDLACLLSRKEWEAVARLVIGGTWLWIGLYGNDWSTAGWRWTTGEGFSDANWVPWKAQQVSTTVPSCVYIDSDRWVDTQCEIPLPFICYTDMPTTKSTPMSKIPLLSCNGAEHVILHKTFSRGLCSWHRFPFDPLTTRSKPPTRSGRLQCPRPFGSPFLSSMPSRAPIPDSGSHEPVP